MSLYRALLRPAIFRLDPERMHALSIRALQSGMLPACAPLSAACLRVRLAGLEFPNPVGLAAGFDKNAEVPDAILAQGFGFAEVGTVTPRPQAGNPRPRIFRLTRDEAVINRLGFNNEGHARAIERLNARRGRPGIVGVNVGANKDSPDFAADYVQGLETFHDVASYFTANISSPNTPGLRNLQGRDALGELLRRLLGRRDELAAAKGVAKPVFLKIAPDLDNAAMDGIAVAVKGTGLDGLVISNTTVSRAGLTAGPHVGETGGLSGRPLFERSTIVLARMRQRVGALPIIGVGGVDSAETALTKLEAGASLVQLYTGMIYHGPRIAAAINRGLLAAAARSGISEISQFAGRRTDEWAARKLPEEA